jgi:hypothetical protein
MIDLENIRNYLKATNMYVILYPQKRHKSSEMLVTSMLQTVNAPLKPGQEFICFVHHSVGYSFKVGIGNSQKHPSKKKGSTGDRVFEYTECVYLLMTEELSQLWLNAAEKFKHLPDQSLVSFEHFSEASSPLRNTPLRTPLGVWVIALLCIALYSAKIKAL